MTDGLSVDVLRIEVVGVPNVSVEEGTKLVLVKTALGVGEVEGGNQTIRIREHKHGLFADTAIEAGLVVHGGGVRPARSSASGGRTSLTTRG